MRLLDGSDAEELFALIDCNRDYLARWMPFVGATRSVADSLLFIDSSRRQLAENRGLQMAVLVGEEIVGVAGLHRIDWIRRSTSIGYWIAEGRQGAGTMTLAAAALTDHAFSSWELRRVEIRAGIENLRSRAIPERLGYHEDGMAPGAERVGTRIIDHVIYAMSAEQWRTERARRATGSSRV
jgi:ribosomal-protein-serine acetyltransferase